jgi:hypothetical protein
MARNDGSLPPKLARGLGMKKTLFSVGCMVGLVLSLALPVAAQGTKEKKKPNDRTVRVIMGWAFAAVPETVKRNGKEVKLDRENPKDFYIPVKDARRVIRASMRSANAGACDLKKLEIQNFKKMMSGEKALGKWSPNQIIFIKHLHIATGLVIAGKFTAGKEADKKDDGSADGSNKYKCSAEERERVQASIETYLKQPVKIQ